METVFVTDTGGIPETLPALDDDTPVRDDVVLATTARGTDTDELDADGGTDSPVLGALTVGEVANDGEGHLDYYNKTAVAAVTREF